MGLLHLLDARSTLLTYDKNEQDKATSLDRAATYCMQTEGKWNHYKVPQPNANKE